MALQLISITSVTTTGFVALPEEERYNQLHVTCA